MGTSLAARAKKQIVVQLAILALLTVGLGAGLQAVNTNQEIRRHAYEAEPTLTPVPVTEQINRVEVGNITDSQVTLYWQTIYPSASIIEYGQDKNNFFRQNLNNSNTEHKLILENLNEGQTYYFRARSNTGEASSTYSFRTKNR